MYIFRNYVRKTNRKNVSDEQFQTAKILVQQGRSVRSIADELGLPESTLRRLLKNGLTTTLGRYTNTFNYQHESDLANHCRELDKRFYGLSFKKLQQFGFQYAELNNINYRFNKKKKIAVYDWVRSFINRHGLSCSTYKMGFNRVQIKRFYDNLQNVYNKLNIPPSRIYFNIYEPGISTVPNKIPKVISIKGKKIVGKSVSAERGELVTAVCCFSASGVYVPPALIFPRKRMKIEFLNGAPPETLGMLSDSGYINSDLFIEWLDHFKKHTKPSLDYPVLLIFDNHSSHVNLKTISFCRDNFIHLLSIPPHTSHRTQPLDRCFFKSLKDHYSVFYDLWTTTHPGRTVGLYQVGEIFGSAYCQNSTILKAINAFEMCGIWPL